MGHVLFGDGFLNVHVYKCLLAKLWENDLCKIILVTYLHIQFHLGVGLLVETL